jgi:hypothetical protein
MAKRLRDGCTCRSAPVLGRSNVAEQTVIELTGAHKKLGHCSGRGRPRIVVIALGGIPNKVQVGDMGVDG